MSGNTSRVRSEPQESRKSDVGVSCEWGAPDSDGFRTCLTRARLRDRVYATQNDAGYRYAVRALAQHHCTMPPKGGPATTSTVAGIGGDHPAGPPTYPSVEGGAVGLATGRERSRHAPEQEVPPAGPPTLSTTEHNPPVGACDSAETGRECMTVHRVSQLAYQWAVIDVQDSKEWAKASQAFHDALYALDVR